MAGKQGYMSLLPKVGVPNVSVKAVDELLDKVG
jgi:hypothetical protein